MVVFAVGAEDENSIRTLLQYLRMGFFLLILSKM